MEVKVIYRYLLKLIPIHNRNKFTTIVKKMVPAKLHELDCQFTNNKSIIYQPKRKTPLKQTFSWKYHLLLQSKSSAVLAKLILKKNIFHLPKALGILKNQFGGPLRSYQCLLHLLVWVTLKGHTAVAEWQRNHSSVEDFQCDINDAMTSPGLFSANLTLEWDKFKIIRF